METKTLQNAEDDILLTADETVRMLKLKNRKALYWLNYTGQGPSSVLIGRELRYFKSDVLAYIDGLRPAT